MSLQLHDPATGMRYVGNNEALYRKVLAKFASQQAQAVQDITAALNVGDMELASRLAHTLKGLSASMGLPVLQETAAALEAAFKAGDNGAGLLPALETQLNETLAVVAAYLGS